MEVLSGRIYDPTPAGVRRVLVDRLWPRGVRKDAAPWDVWCKAAAPSSALRTWYHQNLDEAEEFAHRYRQELSQPEGLAGLDELLSLAAEGPIAILTARRDAASSYLGTLRDALLRRAEVL